MKYINNNLDKNYVDKIRTVPAVIFVRDEHEDCVKGVSILRTKKYCVNNNEDDNAERRRRKRRRRRRRKIRKRSRRKRMETCIEKVDFEVF